MTLVELIAPELVEQHRQMQAQVVLDRALVDAVPASSIVVAQRNVTAATEQVAQARADVKSYAGDREALGRARSSG